MWREDARRMAELGITFVRIGEFAWSRIEPEAGSLRLGMARPRRRGSRQPRLENRDGHADCNAAEMADRP